jgi:beta-xylosidase
MIDGSFVLDKNNNLHFVRADHNGIAYLDVKNNKLTNRKDLLPQIGHAWTEGPSITYINGRYYATYCGNDVISSSYRIKIASSDKIDRDYVVQDTPLLISTDKLTSAPHTIGL